MAQHGAGEARRRRKLLSQRPEPARCRRANCRNAWPGGLATGEMSQSGSLCNSLCLRCCIVNWLCSSTNPGCSYRVQLCLKISRWRGGAEKSVPLFIDNVSVSYDSEADYLQTQQLMRILEHLLFKCRERSSWWNKAWRKCGKFLMFVSIWA